jgi:hypothetical protein
MATNSACNFAKREDRENVRSMLELEFSVKAEITSDSETIGEEMRQWLGALTGEEIEYLLAIQNSEISACLRAMHQNNIHSGDSLYALSPEPRNDTAK